MVQILRKGAEAILYLEEGYLIKERIKKNYRIPEIDDKMRKLRTKKEAKLILEARSYGINAPRVFSDSEFRLKLEFIKGPRLKDALNSMNEDKAEKIMKDVGVQIRKLHDAGIIHGDLTTSNLLILKEEVYFIDFGLGEFSHSLEAQAVDLHLLKEALESTHFVIAEKMWKAVVNGYGESSTVFKRLSAIEKRGRYSKGS